MQRAIRLSFIIIFSTFYSCFASFQLPEGFVSVIDVSGTVTVLDYASTYKCIEVPKNQVIASQMKVKSGISLEQYIKENVGRNIDVYDCCCSLDLYALTLACKEIISDDECDRFFDLQEQVDAALKEAEQYSGLFPSIIHYMRTVMAYDAEAKFILHSLGYNTGHFLKAIVSAIPEMQIHKERGFFNEEGHFVLAGNVYEDPSQLKSLVRPGLNVWQANYGKWRKGSGSKVVWEKFSILFDDNADLCSRPIVGDQFNPDAAAGMKGKEIHVVDTFNALVNKNYFIELLANAYPEVGK